MKVSYQMSYGHDGTVYRQSLSMTLYECNMINNKFMMEIALGMPNKKHYCSGNEFYMRPIINNPELWNYAHNIYLNNTQLQFIKYLTSDKRILDRNTRIVIK